MPAEGERRFLWGGGRPLKTLTVRHFGEGWVGGLKGLTGCDMEAVSGSDSDNFDMHLPLTFYLVTLAPKLCQ